MMKCVVKKWISRVCLIFFAFLFLYPMMWNLWSSFKSNTEFLTAPFDFPKGIEIDNYVRAFTKANMGAYFLNSLYVVIAATALTLLFVIPISYVLARYKFKGSKIILNFFMCCIFIQATYIMVPLFLQLNTMNLLDNLTAMSLVYAVFRFPFSIFLLVGFMKGIPIAYEEAAQIDGCSRIRILISIIIPMAKPGIVTVGMLSAMAYWNEYPLALVLIQSEEKKTLPVGLANLYEVQQYATDWSALFAALIIVLVPTILIYLLGQKQLIGGVGMGGIKE
ncbi:carbohydrate ABC transporter permease [Faecalicatena orotica]|jgi:N-acetylglucosamine transport system permease protein|uniref:Carbohydrate ABC transporter membrane protein 2 (CUT1 family) n=1 Tax=Faecalicatena orotica TaxID=1544 RepID=A0A2Y9BEY9_9FIRM|nr:MULTISPECIES: carbohydrate ABC transporter permease [Clostridia]PWJ28883.1 carbohydrate ABC transporter membrane protein 2 (CUT1 family) [Faecalicatena orotica]SSA56052.1 carbohydrate ABC transporter membrane protein 2, CUT1 family [Faecalicatena orotica]